MSLSRTPIELEGREFDWLCIDGGGRLAVMSTAGHGPVPLVVAERALDVDAALDHAADLPEVSKAIETAVNRGDLSFWVGWSRRGFYGFDCDYSFNRYEKVTMPSYPLVTASLVSDVILEIASLVHLDIDFRAVDEIDLELLGLPLG